MARPRTNDEILDEIVYAANAAIHHYGPSLSQDGLMDLRKAINTVAGPFSCDSTWRVDTIEGEEKDFHELIDVVKHTLADNFETQAAASRGMTWESFAQKCGAYNVLCEDMHALHKATAKKFHIWQDIINCCEDTRKEFGEDARLMLSVDDGPGDAYYPLILTVSLKTYPKDMRDRIRKIYSDFVVVTTRYQELK